MSKFNRTAERPPLGIIALCLTALAVIWTGLIFDADRLQKAAVSQAGSDVSNLAMAFRENVQRTMGAIDQLMMTIITENNESAKEYHIPICADKSPLLRGMSVQVSMTDPNGIVVASTLGGIERIDISDRPHFRYHLDPSAAQPYISAPVIGRNSGKWSIQVTRRISRSDGSFGGVLIVSLDPFYFSQFFESVDLGQHGAVDLVGRDGIVRALGVRGQQEIGQNVKDTLLFQRMQNADVGTEIVRSKLDGIERIYGYSSVADYPLIVTVGLATDEVLAASRHQQTFYLAAGGVLTIGIVGSSWFLAYETKRRRQRELASVAEKTVREQKAMLDTAVNNMRHGLLMFDANGRALVVNRSFIEMYRLSAETAKPGCTLRELMCQRAATCTFAGDVEKLDNSFTDRIFAIPDGRSIHVVNKFMENGGWVSIHEDVTQQRQAQVELERALAEAERAGNEAKAAHTSLREAFDVVPEGLALFDADDRFVIWNERYAQLYGKSSQAIQVGARFEDLLRAGVGAGQHPDAHDREEEWIAERLALHAQANATHEQRLPNDRWLRICERRTSDGGSVGVSIDISELKHREESVRMLFEVNPVPMLVVDCDNLRFLAVNDAAARQYGYPSEQLLAMTKLDIQLPEERADYAEAFRAFRDSRQPQFQWRNERKHRKADGTDILVQVYGRRLKYNGRSALLCSVIDVTEQVQAEAERDRNREFLDRIIENVTLTILVKDARTSQYVLVNKAAEQLWGLPRSEIIGKTPREIFDPHVAAAIEANDRQLLSSNANVFIPEHKLVTPCNGTRHVTSNRLAIRNHEGKIQYVLDVIEDVTERKAIEDQLRQAQKMEAIGNLTGGVAHDFNNLLTIIIGNLDLLQEEVAGHSWAGEIIKIIMQASERGADLARHMLAFSRRQPLQAKEVDINELIATTIQLLSRTLGANVSIDIRMAADPLVAKVDPSQLETALLNMAINARDAMPKGGKLTITTRLTDLDEVYTGRHPGIAPGTYAVIELADNGTGMPPEVLERIFEPFFTTKATGHGTGLGLSMVYGFIRQSGGHIDVYSEVGRGTVFKLFLPVAGPTSPAPLVKSMSSRAAISAGNSVILAVEDDPDIRVAVARQLRDLGYVVREADGPDAALRILDSTEPINLLFTDMIMPGTLNGKELAAKACATRADLKVLFTSGFPGASGGSSAQLAPTDALLRKPYHKHELAKAVERVLAEPALAKAG